MLRVGIVDFLNSRPLAWSFRRGDGEQAGLEPRFMPPARVAEGLRDGSLDVGLVPSIEVQRIDRLRILPGMSIASTHEVRSVLLVSRQPLSEVRRVALDENSRTSAALVRILLADRYGVTPAFTTVPPAIETMLAAADAALIIGDPALKVDRGHYEVHDLAAEWRALTGLPFVFAVWAVRDGVALGSRLGFFAESLEAGLAAIDEIVAQAAEEMSLPPAAVARYLGENLRFRLGDAELAGLAEFHRRAAAHGLVERLRPLSFVELSDPELAAGGEPSPGQAKKA